MYYATSSRANVPIPKDVTEKRFVENTPGIRNFTKLCLESLRRKKFALNINININTCPDHP